MSELYLASSQDYISDTEESALLLHETALDDVQLAALPDTELMQRVWNLTRECRHWEELLYDYHLESDGQVDAEFDDWFDCLREQLEDATTELDRRGLQPVARLVR